MHAVLIEHVGVEVRGEDVEEVVDAVAAAARESEEERRLAAHAARAVDIKGRRGGEEGEVGAEAKVGGVVIHVHGEGSGEGPKRPFRDRRGTALDQKRSKVDF